MGYLTNVYLLSSIELRYVNVKKEVLKVSIALTSSNALDAHNTLVFSLVCQHGSVNTIPNSKNVGNHCLEPRVDWNATLLVLLDTNLLETKIVSVWTPTYTH